MIGQTIRLGTSVATVVGVLEPSVPYPTETQLIANIVTSPHHLGATMVTDRRHRMTDLFGRLAPGVTVEAARAELASVHASILREYPDAYSARAQVQLHVRTLRDQTRVARTDHSARAPGGGGGGVRHRVLECRQSDSGAVGPP